MAKEEKKFYKQITLPSFQDMEGETPPIPESIGPYHVETLLSKGGMSLLYLGFESKTKKPLAIKVLSPEYVNHPEMIEHFTWEAKIISLADHPNIVKIKDYGKWEEGLFIAMEYIQGVSLRQFLMQQSFSLKRSLDIILQVAYALLHLHTHGIIHRDLKPENILITEDGEVKVIDLGIAQLHEESPIKSKVIGTPSYMSPEQKENPQNVSYASDLFSLGIITYELILGKLSYGMINLSLLPAGLQKIVGKTLAISPKERYQDIVDFITDLTDYYKSPAIEKDRPGGDQVIEFMEILQRADQNLSQVETPQWPIMDIGVAKMRSPEELGLYLDFFKFPNNTFAIILLHTTSSLITSSLHMSVARGMIKSLLYPHLSSELAFDPSAFANALNTIVYKDRMIESFNMSILKLIPIQDTVTFLSCGLGPLFHVAQGHNTPRLISSHNPTIGSDETALFTAATDNWNDGDQIILHSFPEKEPFTELLQKAISQNVLMSVKRSADTILKAPYEHESFKDLRHPKCVIILQRIS